MKLLFGKLNNRGASLIEVLIGLFLSGLVTATVFEIYINQHKNWSIQEDVTEIQQNARAAIDELSRVIRMAGHELPIGIDPIESYNTNPDTIIINFAKENMEVVLQSDMANTGSDLDCSGQDLSGFSAGQWAYIFHPDSGGGEFFEISGVDGASGTISHSGAALTQAYYSDAIILILQRMKYFIDDSDSLHPDLMLQIAERAPVTYAENVTDLQFRYRMKNGLIVDNPAIPDDIRGIEIGIIVRSNMPDPDFPTNPYRTRGYSTTVNLRNLDI